MGECSDSEQFWQGKYLSVTIPFSRAGVAQHVVVEAGDRTLLIDAGDGVLRDLLSRDYPLQHIESIFFTHGHYDHMGGLHSLLGFMRMIGRHQTLKVHCPAGCVEVIKTVSGFRESYLRSIPFKLELVELRPWQVVKLSRVTVETFGMVHCGSIKDAEVLDPIPALGYRIECDGETVAVTGDCGRKSPIAKLVKDADLAVIEATLETSRGIPSRLLDDVHLSQDLADEYGRLARNYFAVHPGRRKKT